MKFANEKKTRLTIPWCLKIKILLKSCGGNQSVRKYVLEANMNRCTRQQEGSVQAICRCTEQHEVSTSQHSSSL